MKNILFLIFLFIVFFAKSSFAFIEIDINRYAKIEKIPGGYIDDCRVLDGIMLNKDITHSKMRRKIECKNRLFDVFRRFFCPFFWNVSTISPSRIVHICVTHLSIIEFSTKTFSQTFKKYFFVIIFRIGQKVLKMANCDPFFCMWLRK